MKNIFPDSVYVQCCIHIKDDIEDHLNSRRVGLKTQNKIYKSIFGNKGGLTSSKTIATFEKRLDAFLEKYGHHFSGSYLEKITTRIREKVVIPAIDFPNLPLNWVNNR